MPVIYRAHRAQRNLGPLLTIPMDVRVDLLNELVNRNTSPGSRIEHFILWSPEEAFAGRIIRESTLLGHMMSLLNIEARYPLYKSKLMESLTVELCANNGGTVFYKLGKSVNHRKRIYFRSA